MYNLEVGDRVAYKDVITGMQDIKIIDSLNVCTITTNNIQNGIIEILKVERPYYEVVEETKELLTEEEKEFLKQYIKIIEGLNNGDITSVYKQGIYVVLSLTTGFEYEANVSPRFKELEESKKYTLKELGLEE